MADKQLAEAEARIEAEISSQQARPEDETDVAKKMQWQAMEHLTSKQNKAEHTDLEGMVSGPTSTTIQRRSCDHGIRYRTFRHGRTL
jgi:hypothetical protein